MVLQIKEGGTGQTTAQGAAIALGLGGGPFLSIAEAEATYLKITDAQAGYQPLSPHLTALASLDKTNNNFVVTNGTTFTYVNGAGARTSLGLGTMAVENASDYLLLIGGTITGTLDVDQDINVTGDVNATSFNGSGAGLDSLNANELTTGTVPNARLPARIATDGQFIFPAIQNPSTGINTLDDYEEGTWTPELRFNGVATGITYSYRQAAYIKIGRKVMASARFILSSKGSTVGGAAIWGLPFTVSDNPSATIHTFKVDYWTSMALACIPAGYCIQNTVATSLVNAANQTGISTLDNTFFNNTSDFIFTITYLADS